MNARPSFPLFHILKVVYGINEKGREKKKKRVAVEKKRGYVAIEKEEKLYDKKNNTRAINPEWSEKKRKTSNPIC